MCHLILTRLFRGRAVSVLEASRVLLTAISIGHSLSDQATVHFTLATYIYTFPMVVNLSEFIPPMPNSPESFTEFHNVWLIRLKDFVDQLLLAAAPDHNPQYATEEQQRRLIDNVMSHYHYYYQEKSRVAREQPYLFFAPPWMTSLGTSLLLWVGGFKPATIFNLIATSVNDLTAEQERKLEMVRKQTVEAERELENEMAIIHESVAAPPLMGLVRQIGMEKVGRQRSAVDQAMEVLNHSMRTVLETADKLRGRTMRKTVEIMSSIQTIKFLAAAGEMQLRIRRLGLERDQHRASSS
ncbi:protein DOG1-like 4 [Carica papaya]|uniref:protein DOG1-like 4 n=1 Tax=Carica papaya TaxID=3649 RepID=UPI000B8D185C|nr:protein DOG1-like 4 [Carica papaya]